MVGHPDDKFYDTPSMLDRIRPKARYDIALVAVAVVLGVAIVWAAAMLRPIRPDHYTFMRDGARVFIGDTMTGEISLCILEGSAMVCGEADSPTTAYFRQAISEEEN